jgi:hypothetical protein
MDWTPHDHEQWLMICGLVESLLDKVPDEDLEAAIRASFKMSLPVAVAFASAIEMERTLRRIARG